MKKTAGFVLAIVLLVAASFGQSLGNGAQVAESDGKLRWSQCAFGPDGVLHVIYGDDTDTGDSIWYVNFNGSTSSTPLALTPSGMRGTRPGIGVNRKGSVIAAWGTGADKGIYMRIYNPQTKTWGATEAVEIGYGFEEPAPVLDDIGNIYVFWSDANGYAYTRLKINGVWENHVRMTAGYGKQGGITVGTDGWIWTVWREKIGSNYKNFWSKRTKTTAWTGATILTSGGGSSSHPIITVGPNNVPVVVWGDIDQALENGCEVKLMRPGIDTTRELLIPFAMQHYPRVAVDANNKIHVALQLGGGDYGDGFRYTNNVTGSWSPVQTILGSLPKLPGISADPFGNVAVCQTSYVTATNKTKVHIYSLTALSLHYFYPPTSPASTIQTKGVRKVPEVSYSLSWAANPLNNDQYLQGYVIYVKEGTGAYQPLLTVNKATFTALFKYTDLSKKRRFAITTLAVGGGESDLVEF
ncbi:MAG: hypothetical protein NTZ26_11460 [Candidatus Aminicenantes bacterium]|nr:hypothetical protein [Candidatus Aminicenantes bacterium]